MFLEQIVSSFLPIEREKESDWSGGRRLTGGGDAATGCGGYCNDEQGSSQRWRTTWRWRRG
jgi:hypothetical protein